MMQPRLTGSGILLVVTAFVLALGGCDTAYYKTMEQLGHHKRDIMVDRVESARDAT